jgi:hypothetical protein
MSHIIETHKSHLHRGYNRGIKSKGYSGTEVAIEIISP